MLDVTYDDEDEEEDEDYQQPDDDSDDVDDYHVDVDDEESTEYRGIRRALMGGAAGASEEGAAEDSELGSQELSGSQESSQGPRSPRPSPPPSLVPHIRLVHSVSVDANGVPCDAPVPPAAAAAAQSLAAQIATSLFGSAAVQSNPPSAASFTASSYSSAEDDGLELIGRDRFVSLRPPAHVERGKKGKKKKPLRRSARRKTPSQSTEAQERALELQQLLAELNATTPPTPMSCQTLNEQLTVKPFDARARHNEPPTPAEHTFSALFNDVRALGASFAHPSKSSPVSVDVQALQEPDKKLGVLFSGAAYHTAGYYRSFLPRASSPLFPFLDRWLQLQEPSIEIVLDGDDDLAAGGRRKRQKTGGVDLLTHHHSAASSPTADSTAAMIDLTDEAEEKRQPADRVGKEEAGVRVKTEDGVSASPSPMEWILKYKQELDQQLVPSLPASTSTSSSSSSSSSSAFASRSPPLEMLDLVANSLVTLLEITFLDEQFDVRTALFSSLRYLPNSSALTRRLVDYFAELSPEAFHGHLTRLHHFLSLQLTTSMTVNESTIGVLHVMAVLWSAYQEAREEARLLVSDPSAFHSLTVNQLVDVEGDYHVDPNGHWIEEHPREANELSHFTFFRYGVFAYTPQTKSAIIRHHFESHWQPTQVQEAPFQSQHLTVHLSRARLVNDLLNHLSRTKYERGIHELRKPLHVVFSGEEGIDAGGLKKECLTLACDSLFDPSYGMFLHDDDTRLAYFNPHSQAHDSEAEMLGEYELLGNVIGIALLNHVLLHLPFPPVVYAKLLRLPVNFLDLQASFPRLAASLSRILEWDGPEALEDVFGLHFTVDTPVLGATHTHLLIPQGDVTPVTRHNRHRYVALYTEYYLNESVAKVFDAFTKGFWSIVPQSWLAARLTPSDLQLILCGTREMDFAALEAATKYEGFPSRHNPRGSVSQSMFAPPVLSPVKPTHAVVRHFWRIVHGMTEEEKGRLLHFITGSSSVPVKGMGDVRLVISNGGTDVRMLPSSRTCFSTLVLPLYRTEKELKKKLLLSLEHNTGFGMK